METDPPELPSRRTIFLIMGIFLLIGVLVYGQSLGNEFVRWDDGMLIYENPAVREISPWSLKRIFTTYDPELYIPLTFVTYQIDYLLWGTNPFGYHLTSLFFHIINALLVAWLVWLLLSSYRSKACHPEPVEGRRATPNVMVPVRQAQGKLAHHDTFGDIEWIALLAGLLFLLHPLHTEAVAWASGRKDVLSTLFFLASLIAYLRHRNRWSIAFFIFGLMSKVMVITLPIVLLLIDYQQGRRLSRRMFTEKWPYGAAAIVFSVIALFGKTQVVASSTLLQKILMACKSTVFYLQKIFWPTDLSVLYPYTKAITLASPDFYVPVIVVAILLILAWFARRRWRDITFAIFFYLLTLAPTFINFAKGGELDVYFASDRYAYVPSIGIFYLICFFLYRAQEPVFAKATPGKRALLGTKTQQHPFAGAAVAAIVILAPLSFLSFRQSLVWRDTEALFANVLLHYPDSSHVAHNNLGNMHRLRGDIDRSIDEYKKAIAIRSHPKTLSNLGAAYRKKGMLPEAMEAYRQALLLDAYYPIAHIGLGLIHAEQGRWAEAEAAYKTGLAQDPAEEIGWTNLGVLYTNQGRFDEAIDAYRRALKSNPFFADAEYNLGVALAKKGDTKAAISAYAEVTRIAPAFIPARINLALLLYKTGDTRGARRQFEVILTIDPENRTARTALEQMRQ